jgi:hypothetical protein
MDSNVEFSVIVLAAFVAFAVVCHIFQRHRHGEAAAMARLSRLTELERLKAKRDELVAWTGLKDANLAADLLPEIRDIGFDIGRLSKIEFDSPEWKAEEATRQAERAAWHAAAYDALPLPEKIALKRRWLAKHEADLAAYGWPHEPVIIALLKADIARL